MTYWYFLLFFNSQYDTGYYINPDLIEEILRKSVRLPLDNFGITTTAFQLENFMRYHSLVAKARQEGYLINLQLDSNTVQSLGKTHSYEASLLADFIRNELIAVGKKLTFETVMSHPSKVDILNTATASHYKNYLYFVCTSSPKINIDRVNLRVKKGGHQSRKKK